MRIVINFRVISLATLRHVVQIAGQVSGNNSLLHRYLSCFRKQTRPPEKKFDLFFTLRPTCFFFLSIQISKSMLEK